MKRTTRFLSFIIALLLCVSVLPFVNANAETEIVAEDYAVGKNGATQNQLNMAARADYMYGLTWVCQKTVNAYSAGYYFTFYAGNTYHVPYGRGYDSNYIGYGVSPDTFLAAAADVNSIFYTQKSYSGDWYSTYYFTDCSGFVSWCWGLSQKQSTRTVANVSSYVGPVTLSNVYKLEIGDAINRYNYHIVMVSDLIYDSAGNLTGIEITEQTVPCARRRVYTPSGLVSAYSSYDGFYRYYGNVPAAPYVKTETWQEKACFDPIVYRGHYSDLNGMTDAQLKDHWLKYGINEGRCGSVIFEAQYYVNNNDDLKAVFGTDWRSAYNHFLTNGYKEHRISSPTFDGEYYTNRHPDVAASYKENYIEHYLDYGIKEGRRASATFDVNYYLFIRDDVAQTWPGDLKMATQHYAGYGIVEGYDGYDKTEPIISEVTVTDISSTGYTVTCKVTDNWGIDKVAFPTWTENNGQDDINPNWGMEDLGTKNGDTYTFRVNTSKHNNELGGYSTHIYAFDKGENMVGYTLDSIMVEDAPKEITLVSSSQYSKNGKTVQGIKTKTTISVLLSNFDNTDLKVVSSTGEALGNDALAGTGTKVQLLNNTDVVDTVTIIVAGDTNGSGTVDSTDYIQVKSAFLKTFTLDDNQVLAADVDGNSKVDSTDYMRIKSHFLGTFSLD